VGDTGIRGFERQVGDSVTSVKLPVWDFPVIAMESYCPASQNTVLVPEPRVIGADRTLDADTDGTDTTVLTLTIDAQAVRAYSGCLFLRNSD